VTTRLIILASLLVSVANANAAHAAAAETPAAPTLASPENLPDVTSDEATYVDRILNIFIDPNLFSTLISDGVTQAMTMEFNKTDDGKELMAQHPQLIERLDSKTRAIVIPLVVDNLPSLRGQVGKLLSARLNVEQLKATADLFETKTGRALYSMGAKAGMQDGLTGEKTKLPTGQVAGAIEKEDMQELLRFGSTGASKKFDAMGSEMEALSMQWAGELIAGKQEQFQMLGMETTLDYFKELETKGKPNKQPNKTQ
jgi:hypothetical protein